MKAPRRSAVSEAILKELASVVAEFGAREVRDPEAFPLENLDDIKRSGLLLAPLPARLGGRGSSLAEMVQATEIVARASASTALLLTMPLGLAGICAIGPEVAPVAHAASWAGQIDYIAATYQAGRWYAACNSERCWWFAREHEDHRRAGG